MPVRRFALLLLIVGSLLPPVRVAADDTPAESTEAKTLREAFQPTDGPGLLGFFRLRTQGTSTDVPRLVDALADASQGEKAARELVGLGPLAVPLLRRAAKDPDESRRADLARRCLSAIESDAGRGVVSAALQLVEDSRPSGATETLLAYLPFADDDALVQQTRDTFVELGRRDEAAQKTLVTALQNTTPVCRAAAAEALCQIDMESHRDALRRLLADPKPTVRLKVALALNDGGDPQAVPVLITLVGDLPVEQGRQAEEALQQLAGELAPNVVLQAADSRVACRDSWQAWWNDAASPGILDFFRKRTLADGDRERIEKLIVQLGNTDFTSREQATVQLIEIGSIAEPFLKVATRSGDLEVRRRALRCLESVSQDPKLGRGLPTARLVALRRPPGSLETLLAYAPFADESLVGEVHSTLAALALTPDGKPEPAILQALSDSLPARRAAAAAALCQAGARDQIPDFDAFVRSLEGPLQQHVALALASRADAAAVPLLIRLVGELPASGAMEADETLRTLTDGGGPDVHPGSAATARKKCEDAWTKWWQEKQSTVQLVRTDNRQRFLGYIQVASLTGTVAELGRDGKPRWQATGLMYPYDMQMLGGDRFLVAEMTGKRITERNLKNEILWEFSVVSPIGCQRLGNGNTLVVARNQVQEVTREGKPVFTHDRPSHDLLSAKRLRDGHTVLLTSRGQVLWLDSAGKEVRSYNTANASVGGLEVLPGGRVLIAHYSLNKITEYDRDGKPVWEAQATRPTSTQRLPNGHTLVTNATGNEVVEMDRAGKTVRQFKVDSRPWCVRAR